MGTANGFWGIFSFRPINLYGIHIPKPKPAPYTNLSNILLIIVINIYLNYFLNLFSSFLERKENKNYGCGLLIFTDKINP